MLLRRQGIVLGQHQQHTHQPRRYGYSLRRSNIQRNASVLQPPSQPKLVYTVLLLNRWGKRAQSCMCRAAAAGHVGMQGSTQAGCRGAVQVRCAARSAKQATSPRSPPAAAPTGRAAGYWGCMLRLCQSGCGSPRMPLRHAPAGHCRCATGIGALSSGGQGTTLVPFACNTSQQTWPPARCSRRFHLPAAYPAGAAVALRFDGRHLARGRPVDKLRRCSCIFGR